MMNEREMYRRNDHTNRVPLKELNHTQYVSLLKSGMFWEIYPEASGNFSIDVEGEDDERS